MTRAFDEFFIRKIREGLAVRDLKLTHDEEQLLRTVVFELEGTPGFSRELLEKITQKATGALADAYSRDTGGRDANRILEWRDNLHNSYGQSGLVIGVIAQEWYLTVGRAQEKRAGIAVYKPILFALIAVVVVIVLIARGCPS